MLRSKVTQQTHCVFHQCCFAIYSCVFTDAKPCVFSKRATLPFRCEGRSKVQTQKYKILFPSERAFIFFLVAPHQNFHLLSLCIIQVNLSGRAGEAAISATECGDESLLHVRCEHRTEQQQQSCIRQQPSLHGNGAGLGSFLPSFPAENRHFLNGRPQNSSRISAIPSD